jgi:hypothetical protein
MLDITQVRNVNVDDVCNDEYPEFESAYVESGEIDGDALTDDQVDWINDNCSDDIRGWATEVYYNDQDDDNEIPDCDYYNTYIGRRW